MAEIQITEPQVFEIAFEPPTIPGVGFITTPPGIGLTAPIELQFECPMSVYCGAAVPCGWGTTLPLAFTVPFPVISFPPQINLPSFSFRLEVPPPIFVTCPAFPGSDWQENLESSQEEAPPEPPPQEEKPAEEERDSLTDVNIEGVQDLA